MTVINDRKTPIPLSAPFDDVVKYFLPTILMKMDYFPFGMQLFEPGTPDGEYRFGFQGMEGDPEVKGSGNSYDFGARMYDPRLGRWWSGDAMEAMFPFVSPYSFAMNNPILFIDPDGNIVVISHRDPETRTVVSVQFGEDGKLYDRKTGKEYSGDNQYIRQVQTALNNMLEFNNEIITHVVLDLVNGEETHTIMNIDWHGGRSSDPPKENQSYNRTIRGISGSMPGSTLTKYVPDLDRIRLDDFTLTDEEILAHELKHGYNSKHGLTDHTPSKESGVFREEIDATNFQNIVRHSQGNDLKTNYGDKDISKDLIPPAEYNNIKKEE